MKPELDPGIRASAFGCRYGKAPRGSPQADLDSPEPGESKTTFPRLNPKG